MYKFRQLAKKILSCYSETKTHRRLICRITCTLIGTYTSIFDVENLDFFLIEIKTIGGDLFFGRVLSPGMTLTDR